MTHGINNSVYQQTGHPVHWAGENKGFFMTDGGHDKHECDDHEHHGDEAGHEHDQHECDDHEHHDHGHEHAQHECDDHEHHGDEPGHVHDQHECDDHEHHA